MLHLYNLEHVKIKGIRAYKDYCIESVLSTGDKTLSFLYPSHLAKDIIEECYIRTKTAEFVVKEVSDQGQYKSIKATLNVEDLEGKEWEQFDSTEQTITDCLRLAIAGTGWTIGTCNVTRRRTVRKTNCSAWEVIQEAKKRYRVELEFDTLNKKINIAEKIGTDKGVYFMDSLNLKTLNIQGNSYDFYTRIIAKGKEDLKITVENFKYSSKIKTLIWKDERYTDEASLREDATAKLEELSKPYRAYSADILDLANMSEKYKDILEYSLGDTITLISKEKGIREKQRVVTIREYPDEPQRNTCEIANATLKFEDIQKEQQDTTDTVNNITEDNGTISSDAVKGAFTVLNKLNVNEINVLKGQFGELKVNKLDVDVANIKFAEIDKAVINKADVTQLNAVSAKINVVEADSANLKNVLAGNITADNIQTEFLQTLKGWMLEGSIGNAQISDLSANKVRSGTLDTSLVTVAGPGGRLTIQGNKLQVFDNKNGTLYERIMLGIDSNNNSSLTLRGADGTTVLLTQDGLTKAGFTDGYNKIDNGSLDALKLDINSVVRSVNGATEKIESTVIQVGNKTLNVLLQEQTNTITEHGTSLATHEARITANENSINLKVDTQTYTTDKTTINSSIATTLRDSKAYADTKKSEAISAASTDATTKANSAKDTAIAEAQKKADKALADSKVYVNQEITTVNSNLSKATSDISVLKGQIALKVEQSDIDKTVTTVKNELVTKIDGIEVGGRNLVPNSSFDLGGVGWGVTNTTKEIKDGYDYHKACFIKRTGATNTSNRFYIYKTIKTVLKVGDTITLSGYIYVDSSVTLDSTSNALMLRTTQGDLEISILPDTLKDTWVYVSKTFTITEKRINPDLFFIFGQNGYAGVSMIKLEKGNKATAWTLAQEDVDQAIADVITTTDTKISQAKADIKIETDKIALNVSNLATKTSTIETQLGDKATKAEVKTVSDKAASIEANLNGITQRVSSTEKTISTHTTQIGAVDGKINTAKKDAINTAATDATTKANKALSDGKTYTDTGLKPVKDTLATHTKEISTTKQQVSTIETNLGSITSRVSTVENKTTTIDGKVTAQETRLQSAEQKITPSAITTTISSAISDGTGSITTTQFVQDKNGLKIKNGGFSIYKNNNCSMYIETSGLVASDIGYGAYTDDTGGMHYTGSIIYKNPDSSKNTGDIYLETNDKVRIKNSADSNGEQGNKYQELCCRRINLSGYEFGNSSQLFIGSEDRLADMVFLYNQSADLSMGIRANNAVFNSLSVSGYKSRIVRTNTGTIAMNAYETAECLFGDIGYGKIVDGECLITFDSTFLDTVNTDFGYYVFLTKCGEGDVYVYERTHEYFIVRGTEGLEFCWEVKCKQRGYETDRMVISDDIDDYDNDMPSELITEIDNDLESDLTAYATDKELNNIEMEMKEYENIN